MSIIETFYYLFESDTSAVKKGVKDADKANAGLQKGLLATDKAAKDLGENLVNTMKAAGAAIAAAFAVGAVKALTINMADLVNEESKAAKAAMVNVEVFSQWSNAVQAAGGTQEGFISTLDKLRERTPTPLKYLTQLADRFKGLSDIRARRLADMLGIDHGMIDMLRLGKQGMDALLIRQAELGIVTAEQAELAKKYKDQLRDTNRVYDDVKRQIMVLVLPAITAFLTGMERIVRFLRDNKQVTLAFFGAIAAIIAAVYLPAITSAIVATLAFLAPFLLIGAAVVAVGAAFALAYDDVMNFLEGNDSVIGELSKKWPIIGDLVREFAATLGVMFDIAKAGLVFLADLIQSGPTAALDNFRQKVFSVIAVFSEKFPMLGAVLRVFMSGITMAGNVIITVFNAVFSVIKGVAGAVGWAIEKLGGLFGGGDVNVNAASDAQKVAQQQLAATRTPLAAVPSAAINNRNNRSTSVQTGPITIQTQSTDPDAIMGAFGRGLAEHLTGAIDQFDDGVAG